jgi:spore coat protein CotH
VVINGESWGVYLNLQQFNRDFLRDFYPDTTGARWKVPGSPRGRGGLEYFGDDVAAYKGTYEIKSKDTPKAWSDLIRLCRLLNTTRPEHLEAVLPPHLNIDGALKFLALEVALVNTDGYWTRASDYSLFQDATGQFHVLPYDFNEAMGVQGPGGRRFGGHGGPTLDPLVGVDDTTKPLRSRLLAVPALRKRYLTYVRDVAEKWMDWKVLSPMVAEAQALIEADVKADGRKLYSFEEFNPLALRRFFDERRAFLLE